MTDPVTDMFNRIRNAQAVFKPTVDVPWSKLKYQIAKILEQNRFVESSEHRGRMTKKVIRITLKYDSPVGEKRGVMPAIRNIRRISKPGQRIYASARDLKTVQGGFGIAIVSTPKGLMTNREARKKKLGGEVICEVW